MRFKRIASLLLLFAVLLSSFNISVYASVEDPFEMIVGDSYDECLTAGKCPKRSGYTAMSPSAWILFKDVNFYDAPIEVQLTNAVDTGSLSGNRYEIRIDSTEGTLVGEVEITKAEGWSKPVVNSVAVTTEIKGVHDLYVKTTKSNDLYGIQFKRAEKSDGSFREYEEESTYDDTKDLKNEYKLNALASLGIISAYEANNFVADLPMSRGDFAVNAAHILTDEIPAAEESVYSDVAVGDEYCDAVNYLYQNGILTLNDAKTFSPNKFIKAGDAVVMLLHMLGYRDMCGALGGYLKGYEIVGNDSGLTWSGFALTDYLKRGDAANLLYNALTAEYLAPTWENGTTDISYGKKKGILEKTKDIYKDSGKVTQTAFGTLTGGYDNEENVCHIGTERFETNGLSVENYLGVMCDFFYKYDENEETKTILYIAPRNNVTQLILRTGEVDFSQIDQTAITYDADRKTKTVRIPSSASWIYNNRAISQKITELVDDSGNPLVEPDDFRGTIRLVDNGNGYETVFVEQYKNVKVHSFDSTKMLLSNELETNSITGKRTEYDLSDVTLVLSNGIQIIKPTSINRGMLLEMYLSYDKKVAVLFVNESEVTGTVSAVRNDSVVVDGEEYGLAKEFNDTVSVGKNCVFHLNRHNEIVWFEYADDSVKIGVFSGILSGEDDTVNVKIITESGTEEIFMLEDKARIDGIKQKDDVDQTITTLKNIVRYTPMLYRCNSAGKLVMIDSVNTVADDKYDTLTTIRTQTDKIDGVVPTYDYMRGVGGFLATNIPKWKCWVQPVKDDATLILISESYGEATARATYIGATISSFTTSYGQSYGFYATDKTKTIPDIVLSVTYNQHKDPYGTLFVDEVEHMVNDSGEVGYLLKCVTSNSNVEYWISEDNQNADSIKKLKRGDLIKIYEDMNGDFSEFRIYAFAGGEYLRDSLALAGMGVSKSNGVNGTSTVSDNHIYGKIVDIEDDYVVVHPFGWSSGENYWCKLGSESMIKVGSKAVTFGNPVRSLKVGDTVMVRYAGSTFKWIAVYE